MVLFLCFVSFSFLTVALTNFPDSSVGKESACSAGVSRETGSILGSEDPLEKGMATHSSILAWRIPWTEEPGALQSMGLRRVRHDWAQHSKPIHALSLTFTSDALLNLTGSPVKMHPESDLTNATIQVPAIVCSFWMIPLLPLFTLHSHRNQTDLLELKSDNVRCLLTVLHWFLIPIGVKQSPCNDM